MRTNGFALFEGERASADAEDALSRVERYCRLLMVDSGDGFEELPVARLSGKKSILLAYSMEKRGELPLVHGFIAGSQTWEGRTIPRGEFSVLGREAGAPVAARDAVGTRGLWTAGGSMASDHRLLKGRPRLVAPGRVWKRGRTHVVGRDGRKRKPGSFEAAAKELASLLDGCVKERVSGHGRVAVSFSGGLDSSLLALVASRYADVVLCSAYVEGSLDQRQTDRAAGLLGLKLVTKTLDEKAALGSRPELPQGEVSLMDRALWCIYSEASRLGAEEKAGTILLGQLADELFAGYMKYAVKAREEGGGAAEAMMAHDVRACADWGFLRDEAACSRWAEVRFPYADATIASFASGLPFGYKVRGGERKAVLRAAAIDLGLPEELARAPKKAAQFSSGTAKLLNGLTGF